MITSFSFSFLSFLTLEKESRTSGKHTPTKQDKLQHLEENALVEAIRDTFLPGLSHSDAVIFVTLTVEVFEDTNVPMIFGVQNDVQDGKLVLNDPVSNIEQIPRKANSSVPGSKSVTFMIGCLRFPYIYTPSKNGACTSTNEKQCNVKSML